MSTITALSEALESAYASIYDVKVLDPAKKVTRIFVLKPGFFSDPISCHLEIVDLGTKPYFETISYCWGESDDRRSILVDGQNVPIPTNLERAILHLRDAERPKRLWADAICIDQRNLDERGQQVTLMNVIFRNAMISHIWLGELPPDWLGELGHTPYAAAHARSPQQRSEYAHEVIEYCKGYMRDDGPSSEPAAPKYDPEHLAGHGTLAEGLYALSLLASANHVYELPCFATTASPANLEMITNWSLAWDVVHWIVSRPWWRRVWTLQEAVLPRVPSHVHIGLVTIELETIIKAVEVYITHALNEDCCNGLHCIITGLASQSGRTEFARAWHICALLEISHPYGIRHRPESIELVFRMAGVRQATNPLDSYYGVAGLLEDIVLAEGNVYPDYRKDMATLMAEATRQVAANSAKLRFLASAAGVNYSRVPSIPTWALDLTQQDQNFHPPFNAEPSHIGAASLGPEIRSLVASGFLFDSVKECLPSLDYAPIKSDAPAEGLAGVDRQDLLIETIRRHREFMSANCRHFDVDSFEAWETMFYGVNIHARRNCRITRSELDRTRTWWQRLESGSAGPYDFQHGYELLRKSRYPTMFSARGGLCGLGRSTCAAGDAVYVLRGCPQPVVLRRLEDEAGEKRPIYAVVGTCFLSGIMDGELAKEDRPVSEIILR